MNQFSRDCINIADKFLALAVLVLLTPSGWVGLMFLIGFVMAMRFACGQ